MSDKKKLKEFPVFDSDEDAEKFVEDADLTDYDISGFKPVKFEFEKKTERVQMRVTKDLLDAIKALAKQKGMPYTRYIRQVLEGHINRATPRT